MKQELQRGFTLVEMVVAMGLMTIFMLVLTDIVVAVGDVRTESEAVSAVAQDGRYILARLNYDIQRASSVTVPANSGEVGTYIQLVINGITYYYLIYNNSLVLVDWPNIHNLTSSETTASNFAVVRVGNPGGKETLTFILTLTSVAAGDSGPETRTYISTVGRR